MTSSSRSIRAGLGIALLTLVQALAEPGLAHASDGPARGDDPTRLEGSVTLILLLAAGLLLLLGLVAKMLDLRLKRDGEGVAVKGVVSDALGGDPELFELPLTTTVRVPLWTGSPVTIRVFGEVPSKDLKRLVLRRVERAATTGLAVRARVKSRIGVARGASAPPLRRARSG